MPRPRSDPLAPALDAGLVLTVSCNVTCSHGSASGRASAGVDSHLTVDVFSCLALGLFHATIAVRDAVGVRHRAGLVPDPLADMMPVPGDAVISIGPAADDSDLPRRRRP